jgi:hypothetical protein
MGGYNKDPTELLVFHSSFSSPPYSMVTSPQTNINDDIVQTLSRVRGLLGRCRSQ